MKLSEVWTSLESPNRLFSWVSESEGLVRGPCNLILAGTGVMQPSNNPSVYRPNEYTVYWKADGLTWPSPGLEKWVSRWGDQALRALTEKGPKRQRAHKVYAKIANCLKNSTMSVKFRPILETSASLPRDNIYGPGGRSPRSPRIPQAWPSRLGHQCSWHTRHYVRHSVLPCQCRVSDLSVSFIVHSLFS